MAIFSSYYDDLQPSDSGFCAAAMVERKWKAAALHVIRTENSAQTWTFPLARWRRLSSEKYNKKINLIFSLFLSVLKENLVCSFLFTLS
jgi:hypothetical protein